MRGQPAPVCAGCGSPALMKLLSKRAAVTAIVRSADRLPAEARGHQLLTIVVVPEGHLVLSDVEMAEHMRGEIKPRSRRTTLQTLLHEPFVASRGL